MNPQTEQGKASGFTPEQISYYETLATVSVRRLWPLRSDSLAARSIKGWIRTLRDASDARAVLAAIGGGK